MVFVGVIASILLPFLVKPGFYLVAGFNNTFAFLAGVKVASFLADVGVVGFLAKVGVTGFGCPKRTTFKYIF